MIISKHIYVPNMERQCHGFSFEKSIIKRYNLRKSVQYTSRVDALTQDNIPVQIKLTKKGSEICLGSFQRNQEHDEDFILYLGFWQENKTNIVEEICLYITVDIWKQLLTYENQQEMIDEFESFSNEKSDDAIYTSFRKRILKIWGDRLIALRFKRDHKSQKRIQLAIPNRKIPECLNTFQRFEMKKFIDDKPEMEPEQAKSLDKFYTKESVSKDLVDNINKIRSLSEYSAFVEPSAGNGSFVKALEQFKKDIIAIDILPEGENIKQGDFLKEDLDLPEGRLAAIGNPPFGSSSNLAVKFFNRCAQYSNIELIAFILPCSFRKESVQKRLNQYFHCIGDVKMAPSSFTLAGRPYEVPCCLMLWERREVKRQASKIYVPNEYYSFTSLENAQIAIRRVGANAGRIFIIDEHKLPAKTSHYFIVLDSCIDTQEFLNAVNNIEWERDNTVGPRSLSKNEITKKINELFEC